MVTVMGGKEVTVSFIIENELLFVSLLAPKASEASKGAFHLFPGVPSGYCNA